MKNSSADGGLAPKGVLLACYGGNGNRNCRKEVAVVSGELVEATEIRCEWGFRAL